MKKHTPGPWKASLRDEDARMVGAASMVYVESGAPPAIAVVYGGNDDATLIAAAPALADSLERLIALLDSWRVVNVECANKDVAAELQAAEEACRAALRAAGRLS